MERLEAAHTYILARAQEGCGRDLPVIVRVGGQPSYASATAVNTRLSFPPPTITTIAVPASAGISYTTSTLSTGGGEAVVLSGVNFGPLRVPPASPTGALVTPVVTYVGGPNGGDLSYAAVSCTKTAATTHRQIVCLTAPGAGRNYTWRVDVCGQLSASSLPTTSYAPPVVAAIAGSGRFGASTEGGQVLSIIGTNLGYAAASQLETALIITSVDYGQTPALQFRADSCRSVAAGRIDCVTAPGTGRNHSLRVIIAGQASNTLPAAMSYGEPVISLFDKTLLARTRGMEEVQLIGINFGFDIALVQVRAVRARSRRRRGTRSRRRRGARSRRRRGARSRRRCARSRLSLRVELARGGVDFAPLMWPCARRLARCFSGPLHRHGHSAPRRR